MTVTTGTRARCWLQSKQYALGRVIGDIFYQQQEVMLVGFSFLLSAAQCSDLVRNHRRRLLQNTMLSQARNKHTADHCHIYTHQHNNTNNSKININFYNFLGKIFYVGSDK